MEKQIKQRYTISGTDKEMPEGVVEIIASSESVDRYNTSVQLDGLDIDKYLKNPVVFYNHNSGNSLPIGRVISAYKDSEKRQLIAEIQFDLEDPFAAEVYRKVKAGFLNAASIGFIIDSDKVERTEEGVTRYNASELLEISIVGVPGNADAVALARDAVQLELSDYSEELTRLMDTFKEAIEGCKKEVRELKAMLGKAEATRKQKETILLAEKELHATIEDNRQFRLSDLVAEIQNNTKED